MRPFYSRRTAIHECTAGDSAAFGALFPPCLAKSREGQGYRRFAVLSPTMQI